MTDDAKNLTEVPLGSASVAALAESVMWVTTAQLRLGELYGKHAELEAELKRSDAELARQLSVLRESEAQHAKIIGIMIDTLQLPAGPWYWVYDAERGAFMKKDDKHV